MVLSLYTCRSARITSKISLLINSDIVLHCGVNCAGFILLQKTIIPFSIWIFTLMKLVLLHIKCNSGTTGICADYWVLVLVVFLCILRIGGNRFIWSMLLLTWFAYAYTTRTLVEITSRTMKNFKRPYTWVTAYSISEVKSMTPRN